MAAASIGTYLLVGPPSEAAAVGCPTADASHVTITIGDDFFSPTPKQIASGVSVCWVYTSGGTQHTVTSDDGTSFNSGNPPATLHPGDMFTHVFSAPGTFQYHCQIHGFAMSGTVVVATPTPTVTGTTPASGDNDTTPAVNGTAPDNDTVHVFEGTACATELGTTTADGTGNWSYLLTDPQSIASGDRVDFFAKTEEGGALSGCSTTSVSYTAGTTGPNLHFDTGPSGGSLIVDSTPTWTFVSSTANVSFACLIDGASFDACSGPGNSHTPATALGAGAHTFLLKAFSNADANDQTVDRISFTLDLTDPTITGPTKTRSRRPKYRLHGDPSLTYECKFDAAPNFVSASTDTNGPFCQPASRLRFGTHSVTAHAIDTSGETGTDHVKHFKVVR